MTKKWIDWDTVDLVVFDVDGTLYNQAQMRLRMLRSLLANIAIERSLRVARVIRCYRQLREIISEKELSDFEPNLICRTAETAGADEATVRAIVTEWMEKRPLEHIRTCRYPRLTELFAKLGLQHKTIGIFSDYPATEKLSALGLTADHVIASGDRGVGILKPNPRGLHLLMERANVRPTQTVMIGDRIEKDGYAAKRAGVTALIRTDRPINDWACFSDYSDSIFAPVMAASVGLDARRD
jgi:putative hydrolase of the HAD superfamily